jgi:hypothetical protein
VQAITGLDGRSYTRQQLSTALANGLRIQGYVWVNPGGSLATTNARLSLFDGFPLEQIWADVEEMNLTEADVDRVLSACDAYLGNGRLAGIYSAPYVFVDNGWTHITKWANAGRLLWVANYDHKADPDVNFTPFGGWSQCQMKQHIGTTTVGSVTEIDLSASRQ